MWLVSVDIKNNRIVEQVNFNERFAQDKVYYKDDEGIVILDGVLLNKKNILCGIGTENLADCMRQLYCKSKLFFKQFKGPFSGCYYDAYSQEFFAFANQTGDTAIFYYIDDNVCVFSSDFNMLFRWCKENGKNVSLDEVAANHILSLGYVVEGHTIAKEIKKTQAGEYLHISNGGIEILRYHHFEFGKYEQWSMDEAVACVDAEFRKAVKLCFDKDLEYGYTHHLADMSGGLDSRMTNVVARTLGYDNILNTCYAQKGSREEEFGRQVSRHLGNEYYFEPMDDAKFLFDVEKLVKMNYGQSVYYGITGGERLLSHVDFIKKYGLEHTGQAGDAVVGYDGHLVSSNHVDKIAYSTVINPMLKDVFGYVDGEDLFFYYRVFCGTLMTHYIRRNYTEAVSPFIDPDFYQLCMHISPSLRKDHKLYWHWIKTYYPDAAAIPSTRNQQSIRARIYHVLPSVVSRVIIRICKAIGLISVITDKRGMNPIELWFKNNKDLRDFVTNYYRSNIDKLDYCPELKASVESVYNGESAGDQLMAINVLAINKVYFDS